MPENKNILMIIAFEGFRDEEYAEPKAIFEKAGIPVITASTQLGTATGKLGMKAKVGLALDQIKAKDYDAVLFIGGPGSFALYEEPKAHRIAQETIKENKILGAICAAPGILAHAGVLKDKKATMFEDTGVLSQFGAIYTGKDVEIDACLPVYPPARRASQGQIITASGPSTAKAWGETIAQALK